MLTEHQRDGINEALKRINQASNEDRIRLETLRGCYINLASVYHNILNFDSPGQHKGDWMKCNNGSCPSNYNVLVKLGLV